jgi:hypothetical protein
MKALWAGGPPDLTRIKSRYEGNAGIEITHQWEYSPRQEKPLPTDVEVVLINREHISHTFSREMMDLAKANNVPWVYASFSTTATMTNMALKGIVLPVKKAVAAEPVVVVKEPVAVLPVEIPVVEEVLVAPVVEAPKEVGVSIWFEEVSSKYQRVSVVTNNGEVAALLLFYSRNGYVIPRRMAPLINTDLDMLFMSVMDVAAAMGWSGSKVQSFANFPATERSKYRRPKSLDEIISMVNAGKWMGLSALKPAAAAAAVKKPVAVEKPQPVMPVKIPEVTPIVEVPVEVKPVVMPVVASKPTANNKVFRVVQLPYGMVMLEIINPKGLVFMDGEEIPAALRQLL